MDLSENLFKKNPASLHNNVVTILNPSTFLCFLPGQDGSATNRSRNSFSVQKPFGSSKIGHRSERFCVFLPIFAGRDGEGNEQKLGEEWGQAKQWKFVLKNPSVNGRSQLDVTTAILIGNENGFSKKRLRNFKMTHFDTRD